MLRAAPKHLRCLPCSVRPTALAVRAMSGPAKAAYLDIAPINQMAPVMYTSPGGVLRTEPMEEMGVLYQAGVPSPKECIEAIPPVEIDGFLAKCDGGGGPLGHPIEYIKVPAFSREHEGVRRAGECKYCGMRFVSRQFHHCPAS